MSAVVFACGGRGVVDLPWLDREYREGKLKGAHVLARLLQFHPNKEFAAGAPFCFQKWGIALNEWILLVHWLKYDECAELESLAHVLNVLGGVPRFDAFYKRQKEEERVLLKANIRWSNAKTPSEDELNLYDWRLKIHTWTPSSNSGWSVSAPFDAHVWFWRRRR